MLPTTFELLQKSWDLYKANKALLLKYTAMVVIPVIITSLCRLFFTRSFAQSGSNPSLLFIALASLIIFFLYLITLWASITMLRVINNRYLNAPVDSFIKELTLSLPLVLPSLWVIILTSLSVFGGLLLFIIPGIIFSIWFFFSVYARVLDNQKGTNALAWSKRLVQGEWWDVLWLLLSTTFIVVGGTMLVQVLMRFVFTYTAEVMDSRLLLYVGVFVGLLINILITPLSAAVSTILYAELKKKKQK